MLQFLRDGTLPDDRPLLAQLYREATFFHLQEMQRAIEEEKVRPVSGSKSRSPVCAVSQTVTVLTIEIVFHVFYSCLLSIMLISCT